MTTSGTVLAVTGLRREARIAAGPGVAVVGGGGNPARLRAALHAGGAGPFRAVVSFGIAGGLDPALAPGAVLIATSVAAADARWTADQQIVRCWARLFEKSGERITLAGLAGSETPLFQVPHKAALRSSTGAAAVDMESHVAAAFAAEAGVPFAALRVVCDPAGRGLPPLAAQALRPDGGVDFPAILGSVARHPAQLAALPRLARDAAAAFASLRRVRAALGPGLGLGGLSLGEPLGDVL